MTEIKDVSQVQVVKRLKARNLDILLILIVIAPFYLLSGGFEVLPQFVFYESLMLGVYVHTLSKQQLLKKRRFLLDLIDYDINDMWTPFFIWGVVPFILLFIFFSMTGATIVFAEIDVVLFQLVIVIPFETFIFVVFLPEIMPNYFKKIPGWFLGAGVFFGLYHLPAYSMNASGYTLIFQLAFATMFGLIFYFIYKYGSVNKKLGGIAGCMALHFVWNFWILSTASIVIL